MKRIKLIIFSVIFTVYGCSSDDPMPDFLLTELYAPDIIQVWPSTTTYSLTVEQEINRFYLKGKISGPFDAIEVNYKAAEFELTNGGDFFIKEPILLNLGKNILRVALVRGNLSKVYLIEIFRKSSASASLAALEVVGGTLSPDFVSTITKYTVSFQREVRAVAINAIPFAEGATVAFYKDSLLIDPKFVRLQLGSTVLRVVVTSNDQVNCKEYQITVNREFLGDAGVVEIIPNNKIIQQAVDGDNIQMAFANDVSSLQLNVKLADSLAGYQLFTDNLQPVIGSSFPLRPGLNRYRLVVTADDKITQRTYNLEFTRSPWYQVKDRAPFTPRDGALVTTFKNKLWVIDGWSWKDQYSTTNIWSSSDGWTWQEVRSTVPWKNKHAVTPVVFKDHIWVLSDTNNDVWKSPDGLNWTKVTDDAPWGHRYSPYIFSFANKLWLMGGISWWDEEGNYVYPETGVVHALNDVWSSEDGVTWTKVLDHAPWEGRGMTHGSVVFKDKMWVIGGGVKGFETIAAYNDIWTTTDGINWTKVSDAPWERRYHFSAAVHDNKLWICDGSVYPVQSNRSREVWYSDDGIAWTELKGTPWVVRHASNLVSFRGSLFLMNGTNRDGLVLNDIWKLDEIHY